MKGKIYPYENENLFFQSQNLFIFICFLLYCFIVLRIVNYRITARNIHVIYLLLYIFIKPDSLLIVINNISRSVS